MAQLVTDSPNPFAVDPDDELPVGLQLTLRLRGPDRHRPPPRRRAPAQRPPPRRVGGGQPQYGPLRLCRARSGRARGQPPRPRHLRRRDVRTAPELEEIAAEAIRKALAAGLGARELAEVALVCAGIPGDALRRHPGGPPPPVAGSTPPKPKPSVSAVSCAARSACSRASSAATPATSPLDMPTAPRVTTAHVAGVEELEQTRDTLVAQLSEGAPRRRAPRPRGGPPPGRRGKRPRYRRGGRAAARAMGWWRAKR